MGIYLSCDHRRCSVMVDQDIEIAGSNVGLEVDGTRSHGFVIMVADNDHDRLRP